MTKEYLECVEITPNQATHSIIWLHGLGADNRDFLPITPELEMSQHTRYIFPNAEIRPVGINGNMPMRAWYDITIDRTPDVDGLRKSVEQTRDLIDREIERGISADRIMLAGFSQGGIVVQLAAMTTNHKVCGVMGLSTRLHNVESFADQMTATNKDTPWLLNHGTQDEMISLSDAKIAYETLKQMGYTQLEWKQYTMGHHLCGEQLTDMNAWLSQVTSSQ